MLPELLPKGIADHHGRKRILLLLALMGLAAFTLWLQWYNRPAPSHVEQGPRGPDYFLKNFTLTATGTDGTARYVIDAEYMEYVAGQDMLTLLHPSLFFDNEDRTSWQIEGEKAEVTEQGRWIMMEGNVVLQQHDETRDGAIRMETANLLVLPDQRQAESSERTSLISRDATVEAVGLRVDLVQNRIELLHRVKGRYRVSPS